MWVSSLTPRMEARKAARGKGSRRGRESKRVHRERRGKKRERETKMSGLYREKPLREGQPSIWAGKFKVGGRYAR